jgi:site-specific DNA-methyltransferase (adenine-specific)
VIELLHGDCLDRLRELPDCSVDACVTDPPYGLSFMGKAWDYDVPGAEVWREVLRVLKPGGHLLAFAGTRTQHRMAVQIEDAGFEIRDMIAWVYGSGFPKSRNLDGDWQGWGTALKPALEPITVARKQFKGTVAANVLEHGTGAINVDGCRVDGGDAEALAKNWDRHQSSSMAGTVQYVAQKAVDLRGYAPAGRWPANLIHDGSDEPCALLSDAARFFYCAKASKADRGEGNGHPTVKPTELMRYLCRLVTPPGGVVLDPFMGSGSTGKAAMLEGFRFIGIEREAEYLEIARHRVQAGDVQGAFL